MEVTTHLKKAEEDNKVYGGSGNDNIDISITFTGLDYYNVYGENGADYIEVVL